MKKLLTLILVLIVFATALVSCDFSEILGGSGGSGESIDDMIWSPEIDTVIVTDADSSDIRSLRNHIYNLTQKDALVSAPSAAEAKHEIVIGDMGRDISDTAYYKFERYADVADLKEAGQSAYLIYAEDGSLAIAYSDVYARDAAFNYIIANLTTAECAPDGTLVRQTFNTLDFIEEYREAQRDVKFAELESVLGAGATEMLRNIYGLYTDDLYIWLANLYDPDTGGFYYSNSARDNEGYLPDIESTVQALHIMDNSDISSGYENGWVGMLSEDMKSEMLEFALSLQSANDGYFYHPQWGTSIGNSRKGRDHGWARELIDALGAEPLYPYGADRKSAVSATSKVMLTDELSSSDAVAAAAKVISSKVVATASFDLSSERAFREYLSGLSDNSYSIGNTINSNVTRIKAAGLWGVLQEYLIENQYDNGLWEPEVSYNAVNGCMKLCNVLGSNFPNADKAIESIISILELPMDDAVETICFVYNPWYALEVVLGACSAQEREEYRELLRSRATELFTKTYQKLAVFRKDDGGFSMNPDSSSSTSQGELAAIPGSAESDVNATGIGIALVIDNMLSCMGVTAPDVYCKYDTMYFLDLLDGLGTIVKDAGDADDPEIITFDEYEASDGEEVGGVVTYPAENIQNNLGNTSVDENGNYLFFKSQIVQNPDPNSKLGDLVLYAGDLVYDLDGDGKYEDDGTGELAGTGSSTEFFILNTANKGDCYIFETDLYFETATCSNTGIDIGQISFGKAYTSTEESGRILIRTYEKDGKRYLCFKENWAGADKVTDSEACAEMPTDEWFNIRVEFYKMYDENDQLMVKIKFYLNGKYAGECDSGYYQTSTGGTYLNRTISSVRFSYNRAGSSFFYFNNVYVAKSTKVYTKEPVPEYVNNNPNEVYDFETDNMESDSYLGIINYTKGSEGEELRDYIDNSSSAPYDTGSFLSIAKDPADATNNVLKIYTNTASGTTATSSLLISPRLEVEGGNVYVLDFDYYFEADEASSYGAMIGMIINYGGMGKDNNSQAIYKPTLSDGDDADSNLDLYFRAGNTDNAKLNVAGGQWVKIRGVFDATHQIYVIYLSLDGGETWINHMKAQGQLNSKKLSTIELVFNATAAKNRVQYVDNLSFTIIDELIVPLDDGYEDTYGIPLEIVPNDTKVYDFESALKSNRTGITIYNAKSSVTDEINSTNKASSTAGSFMSLAADPKDATNNVLKVLTNNGSNGAASITLTPYVENSNGNIFVFEFDYYLEDENNSSWGSMDTFTVTFRDHSTVSSQAIYKPTLKDEDGDGDLDVYFRPGNISDASMNVSGGKWVKVRCVLNDNPKVKTLTTYMSADDGKTWTRYLSNDGLLSGDASVVNMSITFNATIASNRVQYLDNLSFILTDTVTMKLTNGTTVTY